MSRPPDGPLPLPRGPAMNGPWPFHLAPVRQPPPDGFVEACDAALEVADKVAERVINHSVDPLTVALASNLHELVQLTRRLRRERGV